MQAGTSVQRGAAPTTLNAEATQLSVPPRAVTPSSGTHLVQSGDTAWNIAHRYGLSVEQLAAANGGSTNVKLGQRLVIPGGAGAAPQSGVQLASLNPSDIRLRRLPPRCLQYLLLQQPSPQSSRQTPQHRDLRIPPLPPASSSPLPRRPAAPGRLRQPLRNRV